LNFLERFKETAYSVVPIMLIVIALSVTLAPVDGQLMARFVAGGALIIAGLGMFLVGTDIGVLPIGHRVGSTLMRKRSLPLMLAVGAVAGFLITVAEPDVQVLAGQVAQVDPSVPGFALLLMIAAGVGFFVALGLGRIVLQVRYRWLLVGFYFLVFALAGVTDQRFVGVGFDAGGATTGPMTVPFILALGVGVAAVSRRGNSGQDSFGLVGLASIGPILAVVLMGIMHRGVEAPAAAAAAHGAGPDAGVAGVFLALAAPMAWKVARAFGPLVLMIGAFQVFLLKLPRFSVAKTGKGIAYAYLGMVIFFMGVDGGFLPMGAEIGALIGARADNHILVPIGLVLGAVVVLAEPAVWVVNGQVEEVSGGHIKKGVMLAALSIGVAIAVGIAMLRVVTGIGIWWFLIPGYAIALALTFFCPPLFTAIAFDSGGVASGPMSSTFILSFTLGASAASGGNPMIDGFGVIAMIAMMPLIAIQVLGLAYERGRKGGAA
jgi:hypothetical protein